MKVLQNAPLGAFCDTFDLYSTVISLEKKIFGLLFSGRLRQVLLYIIELPQLISIVVGFCSKCTNFMANYQLVQFNNGQ